MPKPTGQPFAIEKRKDKFLCTAFEPLPLKGEIDEDWLQDVLDQAPSLLPIEEIDERVEPPLFSLGREVPTGAGPIDNLFISRNGQLVVVETKLWRNPEARRKAVVQILDYGKHVRSWTYSRLREITGLDLLKLVEPDAEEHDWIDRVNDNLSHGRMTLLVVGDGIHSEAEELVRIVGEHGRPDFPFRLALVEMRLYRQAENRWLVVPLAKTVEIERAIVRFEPGPVSGVSVETPVSTDNAGGRRVLSEQQLLEELLSRSDGKASAQVASRLLALLGQSIEGGLEVEWKSNSFALKAIDPGGSGKMLSLGVVSNTGTVYTYVGWLGDQLTRLWDDAERVQRVLKAHVSVFVKFGAQGSEQENQYTIRLPALAGKEEAFLSGLGEVVRLIEKLTPKES